MDIKRKELSTAHEYTSFVREFVTLLDKQLAVWEDRVKNKESLHDLARQMPAIISLVNTVGYLRGQDGVFLDIRPHTENQSEFYKYEDLFESRLVKLIDVLMDSKEKDYYMERLESYLVKSRSRQKPTIW
ncbi:MAG: hypothetical protein R3346_02355 [Candidatus Spechtbacterales bacterium]|nr:hypothetical protein [Candidatus Spechtbacterales bacterium]